MHRSYLTQAKSAVNNIETVHTVPNGWLPLSLSLAAMLDWVMKCKDSWPYSSTNLEHQMHKMEVTAKSRKPKSRKKRKKHAQLHNCTTPLRLSQAPPPSLPHDEESTKSSWKSPYVRHHQASTWQA
jgi:hypothetical protein